MSDTIREKSGKYRILFYDDSSVFGGHELMAVDYILATAENGHFVYVMYNQTCSRFKQELDRINESASIHLITTENISRTPQGFRTIFSPLSSIRLAREFSELKVDIVVIVQGNIEWCTLGMFAAKLAGIKAVSYIPMAHSMAQMNARLGRVRDIVNRFYFRIPDKFITISEVQKQLIVGNECDPQQIEIVYNYLLWNESVPCTKELARSRLGISQGSKLIGLIGRTDFHHKRQDFFIRAIAKYRQELKGYHFLIAGDGPDFPRLEEIVWQNELGDMVSLCPWSNDTRSIYAALDALVIPSAYEGVPLVMLEAVECELPVFATNVDGMAEFLPAEWLFDKCDDQQMISLFLDCDSSENRTLVVKTKEAFAKSFAKKTSRQKFVRSVCDVVLNND